MLARFDDEPVDGGALDPEFCGNFDGAVTAAGGGLARDAGGAVSTELAHPGLELIDLVENLPVGLVKWKGVKFLKHFYRVP